ncbi:hypothetical protein M1D48_10020 [Erwinia sp. D4-22]
MTVFTDAYYQARKSAPVMAGAAGSAAFVESVESTIDTALQALNKEAVRRSNVGVDYVKGHLAEVWHAETLKISATAKGNEDIWAGAVGSNKTGQDIAYGNSTVAQHAELKYYKTAQKTAGQLGNPDYTGSQKVVPADQLADVIKVSQTRAAGLSENRPDIAAAFQDTADNVSDRIEVSEISSKPLTEQNAKKMASDFKQHGDIDPDTYSLNTESFIEWSDIFRESGNAAISAAAFSAALTASPHVYHLLVKYIQSGQIDEKMMQEGLYQVLTSSASSGLRGGIAAVIAGSCRSGLMGKFMKGASPTFIGMATAMALNSIEYSYQYSKGKISGKELAFNSSRDAVTLALGSGGALVGQMVIPVPILGALIGNMVGSMLASAGMEYANHKVLGICAESGWTFWGLVDQSYVVPEEILEQAGFDLFKAQLFQFKRFKAIMFRTDKFQPQEVGFTLLRRGVISFNTIGYE